MNSTKSCGSRIIWVGLMLILTDKKECVKEGSETITVIKSHI
jgi:hypothetical protein